ncbi:unnamed protein product [Linum trigynum]|uniref:Uncharacterized protein n=1 Tax=Linum trigynum TaxID=586398 RepID=A0AAV2GHK1_9ROSI
MLSTGSCVEELQVLGQANAPDLEEVREQMKEMMKTLVARDKALISQWEGKVPVAASSSGEEESSEERDGEKSGAEVKKGEKSTTGMKIG